MLLALVTIALSQCGPDGPVYSCPSRASTLGTPYLFSLAIPSTPCGCAPLLTTSGQAVSFDGGATYCVKGNEWSGIQPGDLVLCGADQPRIMSGGDGGSALGLQVWGSRANQLTRSQDLSHADWVKGSFTVAAPTITANACLAPDGTMTADLLHFPAVAAPAGGSQYSFIYQDKCSPAFDVRTIYARTAQADAGTWGPDGGVITQHFLIADGQLHPNTYCEHTSAGYTRCRQFDVDGGQTGVYLYMTVDNDAIGAALAEQYVCLWQADCQQNLEQSIDPWPPPIVTVAAAVTRPADIAKATVIMPQWGPYTLSGDLLTEDDYQATAANGHPATLIEATTAIGQGGGKLARNFAQAQCSDGADVTEVSAYSSGTLSGAQNSYSCEYNGGRVISGLGVITACANGIGCDAGVLDSGVAIATTYYIGSRFNGTDPLYFANGVLKNITVSSPARRDIYLFGDSLVIDTTAGVGNAPQDIIRAARGTTIAVDNEGVSGTNSAQCRTSLLNRLADIVAGGAQSRSYLMLQCGHNGIQDAGVAGAGAGVGILGDLTDALARAKDAGVHVIGSTVPPAGLTAETELVNAGLNAWGAANGVTIADTYTPLVDAGHLNAIYGIGDGTHLNAAGVQLETAAWIQAGGWFR